MAIVGCRPSIWSTSGRSICSKNCRAYTERLCTYCRWPSARSVSNASELLPEPLTPVITTSWLRGMSTSTFCRLCVRAPRTWMASGMRNYMRRSCGGRFRLLLVVRSAFADVNHRTVLGGVEAAAGDFGEEDAVVAGVGVAGGLAFQVAQSVLQDWHPAGAMRDLQAFERRSARLKALCKMLHEV